MLKKRPIWIQINNGCPVKTMVEMTLTEFLKQFPFFENGVTTICDPPIDDWIVHLSDNVNLWYSIQRPENPEEKL